MVATDADLPSSMLSTMLKHGGGCATAQASKDGNNSSTLFVLVFLNACINVYAFNNLRCNFCMSLLLNNWLLGVQPSFSFCLLSSPCAHHDEIILA
jgi:hypothetical protein